MPGLETVATWPVGAAAAGILELVGDRGDVVERDRVGVVERTFAWKSVTKLCTSLATLVAVEEGTVSLDDPAGPPGSTVAHLLAHASGLAFDGPLVMAPPATRRIYSNRGMEVLAEVVSARSGLAFEAYLHEAVLDPLGMSRTAMGVDTSPAYGLEGPLVDLLALGRELLTPRLIAPETLRRATTVAFPGLVGVLPGFGRQDPCDWGLGFELKGTKRPHWTGEHNSPATFGHFGQAGGFLWVDPEARVALAVLTDTDFGPWAAEAWPVLSDAVLAGG